MPDDITASTSRSSAQTVERAIAILNLFRADRLSLGITEIARQAGLNLTTAHRLVRTLVHEQFMEQDPTNEQYRLGPALAVLGRRAVEGSGVDRARPTIERLSETTGESVSVGVRSSGGVVVVIQSSSRHALRFEHPAGGAIDVHASAMGKVLMAFGETPPDTAIEELGPLARFTAATITDRRGDARGARAGSRRRIRHQSRGALRRCVRRRRAGARRNRGGAIRDRDPGPVGPPHWHTRWPSSARCSFSRDARWPSWCSPHADARRSARRRVVRPAAAASTPGWGARRRPGTARPGPPAEASDTAVRQPWIRTPGE